MSRQRAWAERQRALGNCYLCGKPAARKKGKPQTRCEGCRAKAKVLNRRYRLRHREPEF